MEHGEQNPRKVLPVPSFMLKPLHSRAEEKKCSVMTVLHHASCYALSSHDNPMCNIKALPTLATLAARQPKIKQWRRQRGEREDTVSGGMAPCVHQHIEVMPAPSCETDSWAFLACKCHRRTVKILEVPVVSCVPDMLAIRF